MKRKRRKMKKPIKRNIYISITGLYFLVIVLIFTISIIRQKQVIRQNAAGPTSYGTCAMSTSPATQGMCFAQPNTCASQGLTQYYSETIPASSYTSCGLSGFQAGVQSGTTIYCCPSNTGYTNTYGACGATNQDVCTTDTCIGGAPITTEKIPTQF